MNTLTISQAAQQLNLTPQRVRQLVKSGQLRAKKLHGLLWVVTERELQRFQGVSRPCGVHLARRK